MFIIRKILKICFSFIGSVLGILIVAILALLCLKTPIYRTFLNSAQNEVKIPGLSEPYCPQGLDYVEEDNLFIFSGYMTDKTSSRIYLNDYDNKVGMVSIPNYNDKTFTGHVGGIAVHDDYVYLSNSKKIYVLSYSAIKDNCYKPLSEQEELEMTAFSVNSNASFVFSNHESLWVGEFYMSQKYETDPSHHFETSDGSVNCAFVEQYLFAKNDGSDEAEALQYGLHSLTPQRILTLPQKIQGFAIDDEGRIYLSESWSIYHSYLHIYNALSDTQEADRIICINESYIPVFDLNSTNRIKKIRVMPMSEDLDYANGKIYINFESACKKYRLFNIYPTSSVMSYSVN